MVLRVVALLASAFLGAAAEARAAEPAARRASAPFAATGTGTAKFGADGAALAASATVHPGTITFDAAGGPPLVLQCVQPGRPASRCARRVRVDDATGARVADARRGDVVRWVVTRPVRFLYEGSDFSLTLRSSRGFRLLVVGSGVVTLRGGGRWSQGGPSERYDGVARIELR